MAVMGDGDRALTWRTVMDSLSAARTSLSGVTKADLRAAIDGLDDYLNTNAGALNSAIPQPARANLTAAQKAMCLVAVVTRRWISGS